MTQLFPWAVVALEGAAGIVYAVAWWQSGSVLHGWLAVTWLCYALAAIGLAKVGALLT
tara:strand:- start:2145 stop:2318 length:174 start_codon:yes stop_codon:yes gene_type:complete